MSYEFHTEEYKGCTIRIVQDEHREDPRKEYDHIGGLTPYDGGQARDLRYDEMRALFFWRLSERQRKIREALAGKPFTKPGTWPDPDLALPEPTLDELIELSCADNVVIPYDYHEGHCFRESSDWANCTGYAHMSMDTARDNWSGTDNEIRAMAEACLRAELKELDNWIQGNVAGWIAKDPDGETIESVWGYYPDEYPNEWDYPIGEARSAIDHWAAEQHELAIQECMNI